MKTDSIFYRLLQEYPAAFFEVLGQPSETAQGYTFTSVEVKQTAFRLDGVFESSSPALPTYFVEVQFQEDRRFYERAIPEIILYLSQSDTITDWRLVIWVARPNLLPPLPTKYRLLSPNLTIVSLNQLATVPESPLGLQLIHLIVCAPQQTPHNVAELRAQIQRLTEPTLQRQLIDLMETVLVYKFADWSREAIETMFGLSELKQTRVYQEARAEGVQIGRQEGVRLGEAKLLIRQLSRRFGELTPSQQERIAALSLEALEQLGEALLDFQSVTDFQNWLLAAS